jgi:hypothetical protein
LTLFCIYVGARTLRAAPAQSSEERQFHLPPPEIENIVELPPPKVDVSDFTMSQQQQLPPGQPVPVSEFHRAFESFTSTEARKLSFQEGDVLFCAEKHSSGWWLCELNGVRGWAPASYLEPITEADAKKILQLQRSSEYQHLSTSEPVPVVPHRPYDRRCLPSIDEASSDAGSSIHHIFDTSRLDQQSRLRLPSVLDVPPRPPKHI